MHFSFGELTFLQSLMFHQNSSGGMHLHVADNVDRAKHTVSFDVLNYCKDMLKTKEVFISIQH